MKTMNKLLTIKQKCIEANPEIVELKFGCKVLDEVGIEEYVLYSQDHWKGYKQVKLDGTAGMLAVEDLKEILGRDITLADVLLAIDKILDQKWGNGWTRLPDSSLANLVWEKWNLLETLGNQSQETLDFLFDLFK